MNVATAWNRESKLDALMRLPWSVTVEREDDGSLFARVAEVPDAIADGEDDKSLARDLWDSLRASLALRLDQGDPIPLPAGRLLPWEDPQWRSRKVLRVSSAKGQAWEPQPGSFAATDLLTV